MSTDVESARAATAELAQVLEDRKKRIRRKLSPAEHRELCDDIASETVPIVALTQRYGMSAKTLMRFARDNAYEIAGIRKAIQRGAGREMAGMWITEVASRIRWYQTEIERLERLEVISGMLDPDVVKLKLLLMKMSGDELGLMHKELAVIEPVRHVLEGVVVDELT